MLMTTYQTLLVEQRGGVLEITLNRPDKYNALIHQSAIDIIAVCQAAAADHSVRVLLLTGAGRGFCAGQDLSEIPDRDVQFSFRDHLLETYNPMILAMRNLEKPIIGAINGAAAGAGLGLALACDLRYASEKAKFLPAFIGIALAPDSAVSYWLPRLIGLPRATQMLLTNETVTGREAAGLGLVNKVFSHETFLAESRAFADRLSAGPPVGFAVTKRALNHSLSASLADQLDYEATLQDIAGNSADYHEGVTAFHEKRTPKFGST